MELITGISILCGTILLMGWWSDSVGNAMKKYWPQIISTVILVILFGILIMFI